MIVKKPVACEYFVWDCKINKSNYPIWLIIAFETDFTKQNSVLQIGNMLHLNTVIGYQTAYNGYYIVKEPTGIIAYSLSKFQKTFANVSVKNLDKLKSIITPFSPPFTHIQQKEVAIQKP